MDAKVEKRLREVARHESGHYVVGELLGFAMRGIIIEPGGKAGSEGGFIRQATTVDEVTQLIEHRVMVLYAGCLAESLDGDTVRPGYCLKCFEATSQQDWAKIRELLYILQGMKAPIADEQQLGDALFAMSNALGNRSAELVKGDAVVIQALSDVLFARVASVQGKIVLSREDVWRVPAFKERFGG